MHTEIQPWIAMTDLCTQVLCLFSGSKIQVSKTHILLSPHLLSALYSFPTAHLTQNLEGDLFLYLEMFCTHLLRFRFSIAEVGNKVFAVLPSDRVRPLLAYQCTGFFHNDVTRARLVLLVQTIVDFPLVGSHHLQQLLFLHKSPINPD